MDNIYVSNEENAKAFQYNAESFTCLFDLELAYFISKENEEHNNFVLDEDRYFQLKEAMIAQKYPSEKAVIMSTKWMREWMNYIFVWQFSRHSLLTLGIRP